MRAPRIAAIRLAAWLLSVPCASAADHETIVVREQGDSTERAQSDAAALEALRRTPGGVSLVTDDAIDHTRAASLEDVLESVPGVYVRARGTGEEPQISIRGSGLRNNFHTRGVNVLIDGFPFQNADGFSDVESFEFLAARRVEVFKGANSLRFGGNALGGAINIVTQTGRDAAPLRLRSEGGAFGFWKSYGAGAWDAGPWDAYLALSHTRQHGYRDHAEQDRQRGYGSFARRFDGGAELRVDLNAVRNRQELPGALDHAEFHADPRDANPESAGQDERRDFELGRGAVTLSLPVADAVRVDWQTQTSFQELDHPLAFGIIDNQTWNVGTELRTVSERELFSLGSRFDAGVQLAYTRQPQTIYENPGGGSRGASFSRQLGQAANAALYFSEDLELCDAVSLVGGTRAQLAWRRVDDKAASDRDSVEYWFLSPSLGGIWRALPGVQLYANAGYAFEPGVLFELTAPGNSEPGDVDTLDPQRAWQFEIGARGELFDRLALDASVFDIELRDEIRNVNIAPFPGAPFTVPAYENIDRSRHWGAELALDLELAYGFSTQVAYTYSRFEFVRDDAFGNNDLPGAPRHFTVAGLRWQHDSGFWVAPRVEWVARRWFVDSANQRSAGAYTLFDVRAGYDHERSGLSLFVEGRNLTDRDYVSSVVVDAGDQRYYEPGDGRGVFGGVEWRWH